MSLSLPMIGLLLESILLVIRISRNSSDNVIFSYSQLRCVLRVFSGSLCSVPLYLWHAPTFHTLFVSITLVENLISSQAKTSQVIAIGLLSMSPCTKMLKSQFETSPKVSALSQISSLKSACRRESGEDDSWEKHDSRYSSNRRC